jgi:hypothetical protein
MKTQFHFDSARKSGNAGRPFAPASLSIALAASLAWTAWAKKLIELVNAANRVEFLDAIKAHIYPLTPSAEYGLMLGSTFNPK